MENLTIDQVAKLALVSRSVVSRVLNNRPNVSDESRRRVLEVVEKYNYQPNSVARSLVTSNTYEIGILTTRKGTEELGNGFWTLVQIGIFDECIQQGYFVRVSFISSSVKEELHNFILNARKQDGVILLTQESSNIVLEALKDSKTAVVTEGHFPEYPEITSLDVDNFSGGYKATSHLIELGHRKIGALFANMDVQETHDRLDGYKKALHEAGILFDPALINIGDYSQKSGYTTIQKWLKSGKDFSALFCASDTLAMGALLALNKAGKKVPDDVSVVGFDDLPIAQYTIPPLTTIRQPIYGKGKRLAQLLIEKIKDPESKVNHENLQPALIVRESTSRFQK